MEEGKEESSIDGVALVLDHYGEVSMRKTEDGHTLLKAKIKLPKQMESLPALSIMNGAKVSQFYLDGRYENIPAKCTKFVHTEPTVLLACDDDGDFSSLTLNFVHDEDSDDDDDEDDEAKM